MNAYVIPFERLGMRDVETVGGKNASLGEMIGALGRLGVRVPGGFATTSHAYREFLAQGGLEARIRAELAGLDVDDVVKLAASGARIRQWILETPFGAALTQAVSAELERMSGGREVAVAVRSSATAEAYREFLSACGLGERIAKRIQALDPNDVRALAACGAEIRSWILKAPFPADLEREVKKYYQELEKQTGSDSSYAVRLSIRPCSPNWNPLSPI